MDVMKDFPNGTIFFPNGLLINPLSCLFGIKRASEILYEINSLSTYYSNLNLQKMTKMHSFKSNENRLPSKVKIMIIEDEVLLAQSLAQKLQDNGHEVVDIAHSAEEALTLLEDELIDLLLVNIDLKGKVDGIALMEEIQKDKKIPFIYLTASSASHSVKRAKETKPAAYLLKPYNLNEIKIAIEMAMHNFQSEITEEAKQKQIFIRDGDGFQKIDVDDILWAEADRAYSRLITTKRTFVMSFSLNSLIQKLNYSYFFRIHRKYFINMEKVESMEGSTVRIQQKSLPIAKSQRKEFMDRFNFL